MSAPLDLSKPGRTIHVGVILMQGLVGNLQTKESIINLASKGYRNT